MLQTTTANNSVTRSLIFDAIVAILFRYILGINYGTSNSLHTSEQIHFLAQKIGSAKTIHSQKNRYMWNYMRNKMGVIIN